MGSDLISIAKSGTRASRMALDVTAHNIANASSEGYVRRSVRLEEVAASSSLSSVSNLSLSGVKLNSVVRNADVYRQSEVRRTGSDVARADAELAGLKNIESALEQSGLYGGIVDFEAALSQLGSDPTASSLRAATLEAGRAIATNFNIASSALEAAVEGEQVAAGDDLSRLNMLASELGRINLKLARSPVGSNDQASLLDRRDLLLGQISEKVGIHTTVATDQTVEIRIGDAAGPVLLNGDTATAMSMAVAADGTFSFDVGGTPVVPGAGSLAGHAQAIDKAAEVRSNLDMLAMDVANAVNGVQASGAALDGSAGTPMFTATGAGDIALAFNDAAMITTAPAGSPPNSRDTGNLDALIGSLGAAGVASDMDGILYDISATVAGRQVTRDTLATISDNAVIAFQTQAGVDLDEEAVNLVRFQQAFQASGRIMQVANDIFDSILGIR